MPAQPGAELVSDGDAAWSRVDTRTPAHELARGVLADALNKRLEDGRAWPRLSVQRGPWGDILTAQGRAAVTCGYKKFSDPDGLEVAVLLTDDWRDGAGEDGGRGRAWKVMSGNTPQAVPMNGHDVWGAARLAPCYNGLVLARQGNERHYFSANAAGQWPAAGTVLLNCAPAWKDGDAVLIVMDPAYNSALTGGSSGLVPASGDLVFVVTTGNQVKLYKNSQTSTALNFTGGRGRFYLERQSAVPGPYGNGAPPLLAQPDAIGSSLFDVGFLAVPVNVAATGINPTNMILTAPNHRLLPGDEVQYFHSGVAQGLAQAAGPTPALYVNVVNDHQLAFYDTQADALLAVGGSNAGQQTVAWAAGDYLVKVGASGLPMPPMREVYYTENGRLVGVNGANTVLISDPNDPLHFTPMQATFTANLGEADAVTALAEISSSDTLIIGKQNSVMALYNFSEGPSAWALRSVTREYGVLSALSVCQWGSSLMFLSRRGLDRVVYTAFGVIVGVEKPVSYDLQKYINLIDWNNAAQACVETWNNRLLMAFAAKGQPAGGVKNNTVLALNFLNSDPAKGVFAWEGKWSGAWLNVFGFARHAIAGEERLTFADYDGNVNWLGDDYTDTVQTAPKVFESATIADSMTTRVYTGGGVGRKIWQKLLAVWDTHDALLTVTARTPGWNESTALTPAGGLAYDRTKYGAGFGPDYNPALQIPPFNTPRREDYQIGVTELIGGQPDADQNASEPFRLREDDWGVQIVIANAKGSAKVQSVAVEGYAGLASDRRRI